MEFVYEHSAAVTNNSYCVLLSYLGETDIAFRAQWPVTVVQRREAIAVDMTRVCEEQEGVSVVQNSKITTNNVVFSKLCRIINCMQLITILY
jgi:hypothetical protein